MEKIGLKQAYLMGLLVKNQKIAIYHDNGVSVGYGIIKGISDKYLLVNRFNGAYYIKTAWWIIIDDRYIVSTGDDVKIKFPLLIKSQKALKKEVKKLATILEGV